MTLFQGTPNRAERRARIAQGRKESKAYGKALQPMPFDHVPGRPTTLISVWRNKEFLVQLYDISPIVYRMTVSRTDTKGGGVRWADGIAWDVLQGFKSEIGFGSKEAVEVFPAEEDVINVANMRHIWILKNSKLPFSWKCAGSIIEEHSRDAFNFESQSNGEDRP